MLPLTGIFDRCKSPTLYNLGGRNYWYTICLNLFHFNAEKKGGKVKLTMVKIKMVKIKNTSNLRAHYINTGSKLARKKIRRSFENRVNFLPC